MTQYPINPILDKSVNLKRSKNPNKGLTYPMTQATVQVSMQQSIRTGIHTIIYPKPHRKSVPGPHSQSHENGADNHGNRVSCNADVIHLSIGSVEVGLLARRGLHAWFGHVVSRYPDARDC